MKQTQIRAVWAACFSPTGTTRTVVSAVARQVAAALGLEVHSYDFTTPAARNAPHAFSAGDLVVLGMPVYAGRVPNLLSGFLGALSGGGALAVPLVLYGNRAYEDALIELRDILEADGFRTVAAGAFIGEHSFSTILGAGRPDQSDMAAAESFAGRIAAAVSAGTLSSPVRVPGQIPYRNYHQPTDQQGNRLKFLKDKPKTNDDCTRCGLCVDLCPLGSIDADDPTLITGPCMKCGACVKGCPQNAKYYDSAPFLRHKQDLEELYTLPRNEPETFL